MNSGSAPNKNSKSGVRGVHYKASAGKWIAQITVNWKCLYLGSFGSAAAAEKAYLKARRDKQKSWWLNKSWWRCSCGLVYYPRNTAACYYCRNKRPRG